MPLTDKPDWVTDDAADHLEGAVDRVVEEFFNANPHLLVKALVTDDSTIVPLPKLWEDEYDKVADEAIARAYAVIEATCVINENRSLANG